MFLNGQYNDCVYAVPIINVCPTIKSIFRHYFGLTPYTLKKIFRFDFRENIIAVIL